MPTILRSCLSTLFVVLSLVSAPSSFAFVDNYSTGPGIGPGDGLDDMWQSVFNGWSLLPSGDEDFDGCTNEVECIAGSDPRSPNDCLKVGNMIIGGTNIIMNFEAKRGKEYQIWESDTPGGPKPGEPGSYWVPKSGVKKVAAADGMDTLVFPKGAATERKFYRIESKDHDTDNDGVSDWAEHKLGSDIATANSPTNASGGAASDLETMKSLLSLTASPGVTDAFEKEGTHATIQLRRSYGTMPLTVGLTGEPGSTSGTKSSASPGDFIFKNLSGNATNTVTLPENEGISTPYTIARVAAAHDAVLEVPETLKVSLTLPGVAEGIAGPSATVTLNDADPGNPANRTLYVAFLGREESVISTASGYATALVNGDNDSASISIVFNNLSSEQNTAYIRIGSDLEILPLPLGQVSGANWNIRAAQTEVTDQAMLNALKDGRLYVSITTANNPVREIYGYFNRATGSETFDNTRTDLNAPAIGSPGWIAPTGDALEREIWRFMSQSTFGGTTALYAEIRALCDQAIAGGGTYIDGLSAWLDKQIDPAQTPTISLRKLVMAADMEEFLLRGNKPITYNNNPLFNGATYGVSYVNGMPMANTSVNNNPNNAAYPQYQNNRREWWTLVTQAPDQLRQRVAHALHQICVISERDATVAAWHYGAANYWDMMAENAFGKYRTLLEKVSLNPMMGVYLTSVANRALYEASPGLFVSPDENYAREIMQLFSIGLVLRHPDGSLQLSSEGLPIPTYDNNDITELARVFTGFSFGARHGNARTQVYAGNGGTTSSDQRVSPAVYLNGTNNNVWFGRDNGHLYWQTSWIHPMKVMGRISTTVYHDFGAKTLLIGKHGSISIPARTVNNVTPLSPTSDSTTHDWAYEDVKLAHDCLAGDALSATYGNGTPSSPGHTNTPVNITRWLIQRLVTSNPSAGYIYRVQKVYRDNNGLLGPVIKAILLDYEARSLQLADTLISYGKVKEPLVHMTALMRQFRAYSGASVNVLRDMNLPFSDTDAPMTSGYDPAEVAKFSAANLNPPSKPAAWPAGPFRFRINSTRTSLGQSPQDAPSVFNWFYPDFQPAGRFAQNGLFAPELQIATEASEVAKVNFLYGYTWMTLAGMSSTPGVGAENFIFQNAVATPAARFVVGGSTLGWPASITLNETNWQTGVTVTMIANNNSQFSQMTSTSLRYGVSGNAVGYNSSLPVQSTPVTLRDNEILDENLTLRQTGGNTWVTEGGFGDIIQVSLSTAPMVGSTVTVTPALLNGEATFTPATLTFNSTNWNTTQSLTLNAVDDTEIEDASAGNDTLSLTVTSDAANWSGLPTTSIPVNVNDNDGGLGVLITQSGGSTDVEETSNSSGVGTDTYTIVLTKKPTANVTITLTPNGQLGITNTAGSFVTTNTTRTFTPTDGQAAASGTSGWNVPQTVVVRGNNDTTSESSPHTGTVSHSIATASGGYSAGLQIQQIVAPIVDNDPPSIIIAHNDGSTIVEEGGGTDIITVQLRNGTVPNQNVSVMLGSGQLRFNPSTLTFTAGNYNLPQQVTVSALDDTLQEGMHDAIVYSYSTSSGTNYNQSTGLNLPVTVFDNDDARLRLIETAGSTAVNEDGTNDTYQIALSRAPAAGSTTTVSVTTSGGITLSPAGPYTFTDANWNIAQTITITAANDGTAEPRVAGNVTHTVTSTDPVYDRSHTPVLPVIIDDNDPPLNITLTNLGTYVREAGTAGAGGTPNISDSFTVTLGRTPGATTPVTVNLSAGSQFTVSPTALTFTSTNSGTAQTVTVTAVDDTDVEATVHASPLNFAIVSNDSYFNGAAQAPVMVYVTDNDSPGVSIVQSGDITQTTEGSSTQDNYTIVLTQAPTANVDILVSGGSQSLVSKSGTPTTATTTLNFTPSNWATAQTVNVLPVNDTVAEASRHSSLITHTITTTAGSSYDGLLVPNVENIITDNDLTVASNKVRIADTSGGSSVTEHGNPATDTFTVVLGSVPTADVNVSFASPDNQLSMVGLSSVTFTPTMGQVAANGTSGWNVTQTLTFRANDDKLIEPFLHWGTLNATVTSADPNYNGITLPVALTSSLRDNDGPAIIVTQSEGNTQISEAGATDSYSIVLSHAPTSDVTVTLAPDGQLTASAVAVTFAPTNWNVPQMVTVTAVNDSTAEPASHAGIISHTTSSTDPLFNGLSSPAVIATIWDNDGPGVSITESGGSTVITEGDTTGDTFTVRLNTQPAPGEVVTITLHPPTYLVPVPQHGKSAGYFSNDLGGSSERDNIVFDYTESILLYRNTFYGHLTTAHGGTIPATPSNTSIQNAHWAATKAIVDQLDLWFSTGSMKANWPVLVEPNQTVPVPPPSFNPRQAIMDAVYRHSGGSGSPSTTRYSAATSFNPQNPRGSNTLDNEICDRVRWAAYLTTVGATAFASH